MRVIAGSARGRRLKAPAGPHTRPTADRVRQTLFDVLGQRCDGLRVLDLFAGSGALGIEALSRGAELCLFVESDARALTVIKDNLTNLGFLDRAIILRGDALAVDALLSRGPFDLVLADPPYATGAVVLLERVASRAAELLRLEATVVVEHSRRETPPERPAPLACVDRRRFGDTMLSFYSYSRDGT